MRRCTCDKVDKCRLCWLYHNDPRYKKLWGRGQPARPVRAPCAHEGDIVSWCPAGNVNAHRHRCLCDESNFDTCTRGAECKNCEHYAAPRPETRHLLYHILPIAGNGMWQWNLEQLKPRLHLFNGSRTCAIMTPSKIAYRAKGPRPDAARMPMVIEGPEVVEKALAGLDFTFIHLPNDPNLREVLSHGPLFEVASKYTSPVDATLWCHAKGTTRRPGHVAKQWTEICYEAYLDYWPVVEELLTKYPLAGCFKKYGRGWNPKQSNSDWHYSGSWFWFKNRELFSKNWRKIDQFWSGIEPYPSQHFHHTEAGLIFHEGKVPAINLYSGAYWNNTVLPEWEAWKREHESHRTRLSLATL